MKKITKIAVLALAPVCMVAIVMPVAAQNIVSPAPGTNITIAGILINNGPPGPGPGAGGPGNPGCPFTLNGKVLSASPGVIQVDSVVSCRVFTVPIFFRFLSATSGKIDRLEATRLSLFSMNEKCGASNIMFSWSNPNHAYVPPTVGNVPSLPGFPACSLEIDFYTSSPIIVQ
ncbi:hypothetical protein [Sphingomonas sp.]|uniref:hypothetical protein n=1 Tax=Sphingomonas sp. TaxID=28214 RepID=UPI003D6D5FBC